LSVSTVSVEACRPGCTEFGLQPAIAIGKSIKAQGQETVATLRSKMSVQSWSLGIECHRRLYERTASGFSAAAAAALRSRRESINISN